MNEQTNGMLLRSESASLAAAGGAINIKTNFLERARNMVAPEVAYLIIAITGTVNSAAGTAASGADACKLLSQIRITDAAGTFYDLSGETARMDAILELGERHVDMTTLAAGAADASRTWFLVIPFELPRSARPRDTRVELDRFLDGGEITLVPAAQLPTGWDGFTAGTVTIHAMVYDGRRREAKSRLVRREQSIGVADTNYPINGSVRQAWITSVLATTGKTDLSATITRVNSQTLALPAATAPLTLIQAYRNTQFAASSLDPALASTAFTGLPLVWAEAAQKIGSMPDIRHLHVDIDAVPTSARLYTSIIASRAVDQTARVLGYADADALGKALDAGGAVVSAKGKHKRLVDIMPELARRLPLTLGAEVR